MTRMMTSAQALLIASAATAQTYPACAPGAGFPCIWDETRQVKTADDLTGVSGMSLAEAQDYSLNVETEQAETQVETEQVETQDQAEQSQTQDEAAPQDTAETQGAVEPQTDAETQAESTTEAEAQATETAADAETQGTVNADTKAATGTDTAGRADETEEERKARLKAEKKAERKAAKKAERKAEREAEAAAAEEAEAADAETETASDIEDDTGAATETAPAAAATGDGSEAQVTTEAVSETDVRRSDEDFDTAVTSAAEAPAAKKKKDEGLSKFEKALLLGLGAVVVGQALKNGDKVVSNSGDRVVVQQDDGELRVLKDDSALLRRPGDEVRTETFGDGSTRTTVNRNDGSQLVTIAAPDGRVLSRTRIDANGEATVIFDDTARTYEPVEVGLPETPRSSRSVSASDEEALRLALAAEMAGDNGRAYSLAQVRNVRAVRMLAPEIELDAIEFATGSAAIRPEQARSLAQIGSTIADMIAEDPRTLFLVEGHTDAVGDAAYNLALSDRRAETVALALTEYFDVAPENLIVQGYGESDLKVPTATAEPDNRRAVVRNITGLLR